MPPQPRNLSALCRELEWANYGRSAYFASVVPGMQVTVDRQVVLVTHHELPTVDGNHAALLRASPAEAGPLIDRIVRHYHEHGLPAYVVLSPGCEPNDLPQRLAEKGFAPEGRPESWLVLSNTARAEKLQVPSYLEIRKVNSTDVPDFCRLVLEAFEMPAEMLDLMVRGLGPINVLDGIDNYIARVDGRPVGCASLYHYLGYTHLGSGAVLPGARFLGVAAGLMGHLYREWKRAGTKMLLMQTSLPKLEQVLILGGAEKLFERQYWRFVG